jgi:AbrB family looped-hinge helix DNA binding protein
MATEEPAEETKVSDSGVVTIPAALRRRLDIEPGDKLRWSADYDGNLTVEVVRQRYGAFEFEDDPLDTHDTAGFVPPEQDD